MKNKYYHLLGLVVLAVFGLSQSVFGQVTSYPYLENFDSQSTCGTSCTSICTLTAGGWTNSTTDDKDWAVDASGTSSSSTGPSGDHTTGTGNYIYTEASSCYSKVADLISPVFDFTSLTNPSLEFYYHMYGQSMGSLEVFVSTDGGTTWTNALFSLNGEQQTSNSDPYLQAEVPLCAYAGQSSVTIRITGTTGTAFYSDMAIDDIKVYEATTCFAPSSLSTANEVGTSADLNWTDVCAVSYDYVVVPMGSPQTATAVASGNVATNMATASGLSATTNYDVYVRSNCSGSSSAWAGPFTIFSGCTGALTGSYTVGGSSPDYATISEAITSLSNCGISAPVTINIAAGTYNEQLVIPAISGASATNTVTIQGAGATSTIISYDGTGSSGTAVEFNGAKHVSLKNVGIENTSSSTPAFGIHLWNAADTISIENCDIKVPTNTTSSLVVGILSSGSQTSTGTTGDNANGLLVKDCNVTGGYYGIRLYGSSTTASDNLYNRIENTVVDSVYYYGIYMYYQGLPEVRGCTVSNTRNSSSYGIYAVYTPGIEIHKNWLQNLGTYGIYISNANSTSQPHARRSNVTNNMVSATGSGDALYLSGSDSMNIYYNTLYADADQALWINSTSDDYDVRNNILVSANETPVDLDATPDATDIMDYNVMYSENGSDIMDVSTSSYADLATLQAAALGTNFNTNSVEGDPSFVGSPDLHVLASTANDVGVVIAGITDDFDGDARSGSTPDIGADEFSPASCLPPTAMAAANMTDLTADLSWTPGGTETTWNIEYGPTGYTQGAGTTVSAVTANPYTLTGLSPNTTYDFYIQSDCGTGTSIYVFGATFTTACSAFSAPFSESFDATSMPSCWSAYGSDPWLFTTTWPAYGAGSASDHTGNSGSFAGIDGSGGSATSDGTLESPLIDLTGLTSAQLSFYVFSDNTNAPGDNATLNVEVWDGSVWTNELSYAGDNSSWVEQTVDLSSYSGTIKIRFIVDQTTMTGSAFYNDIMIDDISVANAPSCIAPSSLGLDTVDHAMAVVYWTTGGASDWIVEYGPAGFSLGSGTQMIATNDTITISGLMASTAYEFYVADSCGLGNISTYTGPFAFNTTANCPATETLPYAENFDAGIGCFTAIDGGGSSGDTWAHSTSGSQNLDGTGYMRVDSDANGNGTHMIETLESPVIDASSVSNSLILEFDHYYRALGDSATVQVYDGANWVNVAIYKNSAGGWSNPSHEVIDVTAYANANFQVRFFYDDGNNWAWYWNVDNFSVEDKCLTQSLPYVENFDSGAGCFSTVDGGDASGDTWAPASSGSQDLDGTDYMRVDSDANGNGTYMREELVSPKIDASGFTGTLLLEYDHYYRSIGSDTGFVDVWDGTAWVNVAMYTATTGGWSSPSHESIDISAYANADLQVRFDYDDGDTWAWYWSVDNFSVTDVGCLTPSALGVDTVDHSMAVVYWTTGGANDWIVEYGPAGFTLGTGTQIIASNDTLTITGLSASTAYEFYVADSCGLADVSAFAGPMAFNTTANCPAVESLPYGENFDAGIGCFTAIDAGGASGDTWAHTVSSSQNLDGTGYMRVDSDANGNGTHLIETLESPVIDASTVNQSLILEFDHYYRALGDSATVQVYDGTNWVNVAVYKSSTGGWSSPSHEVIDVTAYANANFQVRFFYDDGNSWTWYWSVDNFSVEDKCLTQSLPYAENFDTDQGCFSTVDGGDASGDTWAHTTSTSQNLDGTGYMRVDSDANGNGTYMREQLVSPVIDASGFAGTLLLEYDHYYRTIVGDTGWVDVWDGTSWVNVAMYTATTGGWSSPTHESIDISAYANANLQVRFDYDDGNSWAWYWSVDNFSVTDVGCLPPSALGAFNVTTNSAEVFWTTGGASNWQVEYGPVGFSPGSGTLVSATNDTIMLTGLQVATTYDFYVRDSCGATDLSAWAGPVNFTTLCAPISSYPYIEDFDSGIFPACYSETTTSSGTYVWGPDAGGTGSSGTGPAVDHTTGTGVGYYMYVEASSPAAAGDSAFLYTPEFDMTSLTNPEVVYYYHMYGNDIVNLDFQAYDRSSMTWVSLNNIVGAQQFSDVDAWKEARINLAAYTTDTALQLRFLSVRGASYEGDAAVDDLIIRETPPCVDPANLMVLTASSNSVTLSWDSDTNIVASTVQYGPSGFMLGNGTNAIATPGGFTVTGLAGTTCYDFYVKDSCSAGTNWVGPVSACTIATCSVSSMPSGTTNDTTDCDGGPTTLMATSSSNNDLVWLTNGMVRETGDTYVTDSVAFTTAFDVAEYVTTNPVLHIGPLTNIAASGFGNFSNGQWITVDDTIHIDSMTVLHQNDVVAFAQIWDASITNVIQRGDTFSTPAGVTGDMRVPVNMVLTPGVYFMNVDFLSGAGSLFRATDGAAYPYDLPGLMSIDSTNFSAQIRIYYTFDLTVSKACIGAPTQAMAIVPGANAGISDTSLVCSSDNAANLAAFLGVHDNGGTWVDNDATGALTDSILDATQLTTGNTYHFSYILTGVNGCAGDTADVWAEVEAAPFGGVDTNLALCSGSGITILRNYLSGTAFGGTWVDLDGSGALNTGTGVFNSNNAAVGTYRILYVLAGVACPADTTMLTVSVDAVVSAGMDISDTACDDETMVDLSTYLDPAATAGGSWTDLSGSGALSGNIFDATAVANMSSYNFQYKVNSACGDDSATVTLFVDDCDVSVREMHTGLINIYPNPTTGLIKIDDQNVRGTIKVEVYAGNGQLMIFEEYAENEEIRLDISNFATGIYTVKVNSATGIDVKRIMKH